MKRHKDQLSKKANDALEEMERDLVYTSFTNSIHSMIEESNKYEKLKEEERSLTQQIQDTNALYKQLQNDFSRENEENAKEMGELKRQKNEAQVEKDLHIQYLERQIMGSQSCEDRMHQKKEVELQKEIDRLERVLATEHEVNDQVVGHLNERVAQLNQ